MNRIGVIFPKYGLRVEEVSDDEYSQVMQGHGSTPVRPQTIFWEKLAAICHRWLPGD